ncbi:MAG: 50S ribosomal protein L21 [Candidatus Bipolaricaulota bacterium]|nr:50S ribosomal protein L21 [Candidatus Bipolaricaulota bacterium]MCS7274023.1 50S ribosomal protein L21 [Candidatus Bipolaricaulota bacterium]MDW8110223.1 50S ribosomal protein L21 [Candidatus Bipolaricaulota bacterium]MDW8328877.1 50S ribosomal protein L21 [Candidatus Bipolaricaulota bacterium]
MTRYAVIETGSKQYRVCEGDRIVIERLKGARVGERVEFDRVLLVGGEPLHVGAPHLKGARVIAEITRELRGPKLDVFKYKRKTRRRRKIGHRQYYLEATIKEIRA